MSDTSPAPLLALSMDDYESKLPLLEDMPLKHARRYIEPLKYQALVGAVLGTFERYPAIEAIQFTDDGTRDSNVNGYDIIAQGPGTEDIPTEHNGAWDAMTISDLDKLLWWFFDDEDFRAGLSQARFTREEAVDQLHTMLDDEIKHWDAPWEDFLQQVYTHLGRPNALQEQALATAEMDPLVAEVFKKLRSTQGLDAALDAAPDDTWRARKLEKGLDGELVEWSALAVGLMYLLNHPDERANHELWSLINFTTSRADSENAQRFLKLAGPHDDNENRAPKWVDPSALMWILSGRCSLGIGGYRRRDWSNAMLDWGQIDAVWADYAAMEQCQWLARKAQDTSFFSHHAYKRCKDMLDRIWTLWIAADCPQDEKHFIQTYEMMSDTLLYYGGRTKFMPSWVAGKGMSGFVVGPGTKLSMADRLEDAPVDLALRMSLTTLANETDKAEVAAAEAFILVLLDKGACLDEDDVHLEKRLEGKGVSDTVRARIRGSLKINQAKALAQQVQAAIEAKGWTFVCEEINMSPEEVCAVDGLLPLLMMRAWDQPPPPVCFRKDEAALLDLKVEIQDPLRADDLFENVMTALTSLVNEAGTQPVGLDALYQNWLNEKKWQAWVQ